MKREAKEALFRYGFPVLIVLLAGILIGGAAGILSNTWLRSAENEKLPEDEPGEGIGRMEAARYLAEKEYTEQVAHRVDVYTAWEGSAPVWFRPWEEMAAEWEDSLLTAKLQPSYSQLSGKFGASLGQVSEVASCQQVAEANNEAVSVDYVITSGENLQVAEAEAHAPEGIDPGGNDWNLCTERVGWDGHRAEAWELELFARIFYREFWGTSPECCEAGCDAILRLWEKGEYSATLGGTLTAVTDSGAYAFSTYPAAWADDYDAAGLDWCRAYTAARFAAGPEWIAEYFRLDGYHDWGEWSPIPAYEIDGVYFSVGVR